MDERAPASRSPPPGRIDHPVSQRRDRAGLRRPLAPEGLTFHTARVMLGETTPEGLRAMNAGVAAAAELIASVTPDVVAYACTSGTFIDGADGLARQVAMIQMVVGCDVVATARCMVEAIKFLGLTRIALATPYLDVINHLEREILKAEGLTVTAMKGLGLSGKVIPSRSRGRR